MQGCASVGHTDLQITAVLLPEKTKILPLDNTGELQHGAGRINEQMPCYRNPMKVYAQIPKTDNKRASFLMGGFMGREGGMCFRFELSPSVY